RGKPEPPGVVRANISVPKGLKARMDAEAASVNWSAVAAAAFEAKLQELASRKEAKTLDDVVARLKAAAELEASADYQDGLEAGRRWARQVARPKELRRVAEYLKRCAAETGPKVEWWDVDHSGWPAPFGATDYFVFQAQPSRGADRDAAHVFWREALG